MQVKILSRISCPILILFVAHCPPLLFLLLYDTHLFSEWHQLTQNTILFKKIHVKNVAVHLLILWNLCLHVPLKYEVMENRFVLHGHVLFMVFMGRYTCTL